MNAPDRIIPIVAEPSLVVRASSWGGLFDCAMRWEGEQMLGIRKAAGLRAHLGTSVHASTAAYDLGRLPGGQPISVDDAASVFVDTLRNPGRDVDFGVDDLTLVEAERTGLALHTAYCYDLAPQFTFQSVEMTLSPLDIDCGGGTVVRLTGQMDRARVAETPAGPVIADVKTGTRVVVDGKASTRGRSPQLGTYQLLYEETAQQPSAGAQILALPTKGKAVALASDVFDARRVMVGVDGQPGLIDFAAQMFRAGLFPPNPSSNLCSQKYCARWATCNFHE